MTITSGIGLMSGINIEDIVTQLMAIEARGKDSLSRRVDVIDDKRSAMMQIQARIMAIQLAAVNFNKQSVFEQKAVTSSDEDVITGSATRFADTGLHRFIVARLASNSHLVSNVFSDSNSTIGRGQISIEMGQGQVARHTPLSIINGQRGFQRGNITITDSSSKQAEIDLSTALTIQDVLDAINDDNTISVRASVSGDHIVLTDYAGGPATLFVDDNDTAASLGLATLEPSDSGNIYSGSDLLSITANTSLKSLNDGNGIRMSGSALGDIHFDLGIGPGFSVALKDTLQETIGDTTASNTLRSLNGGAGVRLGKFRITDRNGRHVDIDLSEDMVQNPFTLSLGQVKEKIETAAKANGMDITVSFNGADHLTITDGSEAHIGETTTGKVERRSDFIIEDIEGGHAADDLGIVAQAKFSSIEGETIWQMDSLGDVMAAINYHWENPILDFATGQMQVAVAINAAGTGLEVTGQSPGLTVSAVGDSNAVDDLGILGATSGGQPVVGRRLIAGLNTVMLRSLNGGSGNLDQRITSGGIISLADGAGNTADLNFSLDPSDSNYAFSLQDVIDRINSSGTNIQAAVNSVGNGIVLTDTTETPTGNMAISGDWAQKLGIQLDAADGLNSVSSGNLQLQYISEATLLSDLRQGQGIRLGIIYVTDRDGNSKTIDFSDVSQFKTVGDIIDQLNKTGTNIAARINDTGDGILIYDKDSGVDNAITITDTEGNTAKDLRILGSANYGENFIDGSYEFTLDIGGGDSLEEIMNDIDSADIGVQASIIKDGTGYRLSLSSQVTGQVGTIYVDGGTTALKEMTVIAAGQDAILFYGGTNNRGGLLITSSTNTVQNVIKGVTLDLYGVSDQPIEIRVEDDIDAIVAQMGAFVEAYNEAMSDIADLTRFDPDTLERGLLFGDSTMRSIVQTLQSITYRTVPGVARGVNRLSRIGIGPAPLGRQTETDAEGNDISFAVATTPRLHFDEAKFREAFSDPELHQDVIELFTQAKTGVGDYLADALEDIAGSFDSTIRSRLDGMDSQQRLLDERIDRLDGLLEAKEQRLYLQFYAMEKAIASMQTQQGALTSLSNMVSSFRS